MKKKNNLTSQLKLKKTIIAKLTPKDMGKVVGGIKTVKTQTTSTTEAQCTTV